MGYIGDHKQSPESLPFQSKMLLQYKEVFLQAMRTAHSYLTKDLTVCKIILRVINEGLSLSLCNIGLSYFNLSINQKQKRDN